MHQEHGGGRVMAVLARLGGGGPRTVTALRERGRRTRPRVCVEVRATCASVGSERRLARDHPGGVAVDGARLIVYEPDLIVHAGLMTAAVSPSRSRGSA